MYFLHASKHHQVIILNWLKKPHVKEFYYGNGLENTKHNLELYCNGINDNGDYIFNYWVAFINDEPFGFLMTSEVTGPYNLKDDYNKWYIDGKKTFTLDLLIGPEKFLGKGLSHQMITNFILDQFSDANYFIIDPEKSNTKAIHVYEKTGFKKVGLLYPAYNPIPHVMMRLDVNELKKQT